MKKWFTTLKSITPYIFKVSTPHVSGTGFQMFRNNQGLCGIATAYHVVDHAYEWEEAIKITHYESQETKVLKVDSRVIWAYPKKDLAFIIFLKNDLPIKEVDLKLIDPKKFLKQGVELGWLGFPSVAPNNLCFFAGHTSSYITESESYLVDGVAINGVSGGPAFYIDPTSGDAKICGVISAYMPNRAYGEPLPGLSVMRSVEPYQDDLQRLRTLDEAEEKKTQQEQEKQIDATPQQKSPKSKRETTSKRSIGQRRKKTIHK